jgi:hypothetical protein
VTSHVVCCNGRCLRCPGVSVLCQVSPLCQVVRDLLNTANTNLKIHETGDRGVWYAAHPWRPLCHRCHRALPASLPTARPPALLHYRVVCAALALGHRRLLFAAHPNGLCCAALSFGWHRRQCGRAAWDATSCNTRTARLSARLALRYAALQMGWARPHHICAGIFAVIGRWHTCGRLILRCTALHCIAQG